VFLGAYFQYAVVSTEGVHAESVRDLRAGVQAHFHTSPGARSDPWIGAGFGVVQRRSSGTDTYYQPTQREVDYTDLHNGLELKLQGGLDVMTRLGLTLGPFGSVALYRYRSVDYRADRFEDRGLSGEPIQYLILIGASGCYVLGSLESSRP